MSFCCLATRAVSYLAHRAASDPQPEFVWAFRLPRAMTEHIGRVYLDGDLRSLFQFHWMRPSPSFPTQDTCIYASEVASESRTCWHLKCQEV
nr:hypothetical protein CFP56_56899 [Quercus suber]